MTQQWESQEEAYPEDRSPSPRDGLLPPERLLWTHSKHYKIEFPLVCEVLVFLPPLLHVLSSCLFSLLILSFIFCFHCYYSAWHIMRTCWTFLVMTFYYFFLSQSSIQPLLPASTHTVMGCTQVKCNHGTLQTAASRLCLHGTWLPANPHEVFSVCQARFEAFTAYKGRHCC